MSVVGTTEPRRETGSWVEVLIGGLAGGDLLVRVIPELVGLGDSIILPTGVLLASQFVLDWSTLGWVFAWLLYGTVVFQMAPLLLPRDQYEWAHGLVNRATMAVGAVGIGLFAERAVLHFFHFGTSPLPLPRRLEEEGFLLVFVAVVALVVVTRYLPPVRVRSRFLYAFDWEIYPVESAPGIWIGGPYLLVVFFIGSMLALVSILFPLPEILILAVVGLDRVAYLVGNSESVPARRDVGERVVQAASALWVGPRGFVWVFYIVVLLLTAFGLDAMYINFLNPVEMAGTRPLDALFVFYCLGGMTFLVTVSATRLAERVPAQLQSGTSPDSSATPASRGTPPGTDRGRIPGFLVPAALLMSALEVAAPDFPPSTGWNEILSDQVAQMTLSAPVVAVAAGAGLLGFATVAWPRLFPSSGYGDYKATVLSFTCFFAVLLGFGFNVPRLIAAFPTDVVGMGSVLGSVAHFAVLGSSVYLGWEVFSFRDRTDGVSKADLIAEGGILLGGVVVLSLVGGVVGVLLRWLPGFAPVVAVATIIAWGLYVGVAGVLVRVVGLVY